MESIEFLNGVVISIGNETFSFCSSLRRFTCPEGNISIESMAFYNCKYLTKAELNNGKAYIGSNAF